MKDYYKHTVYQHVEDFKRLDFIVNQTTQYNKETSKVLDIGCGNGNIALALGSLGFNVKGIDVDDASIETANSINTFANVAFEVADANKFTINDEYDVVICSEVLEHLPHPEELVQSAHRILKPGGIMIVTVPNGYGPRETIMTKPMQWMMRKGYTRQLVKVKKAFGYANATEQSSNPDLTHIQFFSRTKLTNMMQSAGFSQHAFAKADFFDRIFPYSMLANRISALQKLDCAVADVLPAACTCGFYTAWKK
jgi:2-polyprenyl-3-methyl-5-hydroxy-6-metoxy-1,4-benzoquinol methylase